MRKAIRMAVIGKAYGMECGVNKLSFTKKKTFINLGP